MLSKLDLLNHFMSLEQPLNSVQVEYIWIDGTGQELRSKARTLYQIPTAPKDVPVWHYCATACGQAQGNLSEFSLTPVAMYRDPFRGGDNKLVLCEARDTEDRPAKGNHRQTCLPIMAVTEYLDPWFGVEQEYTLLNGRNDRPLKWPQNGFPGPQGSYYCGVGTGRVNGREIAESHYRACLYAGIPISGINAEVMLSQWEYQVGPCKGIKIGDDLWLSRYLLHRVAEMFDAKVTIDPKPVLGDWNGTGAHMNFSTVQMREPGGLEHIENAIKKLSAKHEEHMKVYDLNGGEDNKKRLDGVHDCSSFDRFTAGVRDRGASVRIPRAVAEQGFGFLEDRRPASNADPYLVAGALVRTICLE